MKDHKKMLIAVGIGVIVLAAGAFAYYKMVWLPANSHSGNRVAGAKFLGIF